MKEPAKEGRDQRVHSDPASLDDPVSFISGVKGSLQFATDNQERIDVLARAKKHADREWLCWSDVRKYIDNQLAVVEYEAQLKLPL